MLVLERPWCLLLLCLVPLWFLAKKLWRRDLLLPLGLVDSEGTQAPAAPRWWSLLRKGGEVFATLGFSLLVVAASGPTLVSQLLLYLSRGDEIMIVVDVSPSMAAGDLKPDRLSAARGIVKGFLATRRNEAVGLVAFGGEAALVAPPTLDYASLAKRLDSLVPGMLGEGTALGAGIGVAAAHGLSSGIPRGRHIVVLTDGENNAGAIAPISAAAMAAEEGFAVSVVGVGSTGEVPLDYRDPETGATRSGVYLSAFERGALEAVARRGGGDYYGATDGASLVAAFAKIAEGSVSLSRTRSIAEERSLAATFLALALCLLVLARLFGLAAGSGFP